MSPLLVMILASVAPLLVGFIGIKDDETDSDAEEDASSRDDADDPVQIMDVASFLESARSTEDNSGPVDGSRGTDADAVFVGDDGVANFHDASGGSDTLTGGDLGDTLIGGDGADTISGGAGDDALFGGFSDQSRADDDDADLLDGGAGDDALFLGDGDTASGGAGQDAFATVFDATDTLTITDFDPAEDALAIETEDPDTASVTEQVVEEGGLSVTLSTGLVIRLEGVTEPLADGTLQFVRLIPTPETT